MECIYVLSSSLYKGRLNIYKNVFCIPDRSDQVHYFMAPFCSTCSLFTFVCVCFTNCSINYSGRLIVLLTRSPKIIPTQDPHEDFKKREKTKTYYYDYCRTKIKAKYSNILKMCWSSAMLCLKCHKPCNKHGNWHQLLCKYTASAIGRKLMDPEGGAEISADTSADVGQSWTPTNASVIIVSLQRGSPIFHTRSITWFLCDQIITHSQKRLWTLAIYWLMYKLSYRVL